MNTRKNRTSLAGRIARLALRGTARARRLLAVALAMAWSLPAAAGEAAFERALAEQARYLSSEALAYEHGEGVPRDQPYAALLYCESARLGDTEGMYALGWMYANGRGVERNDAYAGTLFAMAAAKGDEHAERMLRYTGKYTGEVPDCLHTPSSQIVQRWPVEALIARLPAARQAVARMLAELAPKYGVRPEFALAIGLTESALNPQALSPKNAMGVMQLIPATAERFNVAKPYDPEQNIRGGLAYLRWLLAYFQGDVALVAAAYNAGEGKVERYKGIPPYQETRKYVKRILHAVGSTFHPFDHKITRPSAVIVSPPSR